MRSSRDFWILFTKENIFKEDQTIKGGASNEYRKNVIRNICKAIEDTNEDIHRELTLIEIEDFVQYYNRRNTDIANQENKSTRAFAILKREKKGHNGQWRAVSFISEKIIFAGTKDFFSIKDDFGSSEMIVY